MRKWFVLGALALLVAGLFVFLPSPAAHAAAGGGCQQSTGLTPANRTDKGHGDKVDVYSCISYSGGAVHPDAYVSFAIHSQVENCTIAILVLGTNPLHRILTRADLPCTGNAQNGNTGVHFSGQQYATRKGAYGTKVAVFIETSQGEEMFLSNTATPNTAYNSPLQLV